MSPSNFHLPYKQLPPSCYPSLLESPCFSFLSDPPSFLSKLGRDPRERILINPRSLKGMFSFGKALASPRSPPPRPLCQAQACGCSHSYHRRLGLRPQQASCPFCTHTASPDRRQTARPRLPEREAWGPGVQLPTPPPPPSGTCPLRDKHTPFRVHP